MFDRRIRSRPAAPFRGVPDRPVDLAALVLGRSTNVVASRLPRLFPLCRASQSLALSRAMGLAEPSVSVERELRRDHLVKIFVQWPAHFGFRPGFAPTLRNDTRAALVALFGGQGRVPMTAQDTLDYIRSEHGAAPLFSEIAACFGPGTAVANGLPITDERSVFSKRAQDNSPVARRHTHPGLLAVEAMHGRGPLWRALGRVLDLGLSLQGHFPDVTCRGPNRAVATTARGLYGFEIDVEDGTVVRFDRTTPTDHLLTPGGVLDLSLASLPADQGARLPLLLDILDPCTRIDVVEIADTLAAQVDLSTAPA